MVEPKAFASLTSGLLARKGHAKPAMRPQGHLGGIDDLGWNDMGGPVPAQRTPVAALTSVTVAPTPAPPVPEVVRRQAAIAGELGIAVEPLTAPVVAPVAEAAVVVAPPAPEIAVVLAQPRALPGAKAKAAFTLRLDRERHLKLRLACAVTRRSAQAIVTDALDAVLRAMPELDTLAAEAAGTR